MHVAITGAGGAVGRVLVPEFESDRLRLFTHGETDDLDSQPLDATDRRAFVDALRAAGRSDSDESDGVEALVHLAWAPADHEEWNDDHAANVAMTANAFEAALACGVDRVVVASSCHAVGMYNRDDPVRFESTVQNPTDVVHPATPPRPDSFYGVAKVAVEATAAYYADRHGVEAVVVRIGWLMTADELRETWSDSPDRHRFARAMWLSPRDCRALFRAAVEAPLDRSPVVAHGISCNGDRFLTLTETMQRLGYRPRDDACEVLDE